MVRTREHDACPGTLVPHNAADGALVRVRLPGGAISPAQLATLTRIATEAAGALELTSRGGVQLRGVKKLASVIEAVAGTGLLPSAPHDRVRNIVSSPLSGRYAGCIDVRPWVSELDAALQSETTLTTLPGRFLFSIDDGRGDVSGICADVGVQVLGDTVALLIAGVDSGIRQPAATAVSAMIEIATRFARHRGKCWRIREMADHSMLLSGFTATSVPSQALPANPAPPIGWIEQDDGRISLGATVPLGVLSARAADTLVAIDHPLVITPWRTLLICDLDSLAAVEALSALVPMGLVFDNKSPWLKISSCVGSPGCTNSAADVRADAAAAVARAVAEDNREVPRQHLVGCLRACGAPPVGTVLVATGRGYRVMRTTGANGRAVGQKPKP